MAGSLPLSPDEVEAIAQTFLDHFGQEPDGIYLVGSHADGTATIDSDVDIAIETSLPLSKFGGPGFAFFAEINPGKVPLGIVGIGIGPGLTLIGSDPGEIPKRGLIDPFFKAPGSVRSPAVKLR